MCLVHVFIFVRKAKHMYEMRAQRGEERRDEMRVQKGEETKLKKKKLISGSEHSQKS